MSSLLVALIVFATTVCTVALGIFAAYCAIAAILTLFTRQRERASLPLVANQSHASGD